MLRGGGAPISGLSAQSAQYLPQLCHYWLREAAYASLASMCNTWLDLAAEAEVFLLAIQV